jgi:CHAD domain-containing protein
MILADPEVLDYLRVAAVEPLGETQQRGQHAHDTPASPVECGVPRVALSRRGLPMIPSDERDDDDLLGIESAQTAVGDEVVRVLVMPFVADVRADVVQEGGVLEPLALAVAEPVISLRGVEERQGQTRHLLRVCRIVAAPLAQLDDAPAAHVGIPLYGVDVGAIPLDVVEHQPFAQREVAQGQILCAQLTEERVDEHRAGDGNVRAARVESRKLQPFVERQPRQPLPEPPKLACLHAHVPHLVWRVPRADREGPEGQDRARGADDAVKAALRDLFDEAPDFLADVLDEPAFVPAGQRVALHEPLGEANDAQLEAAARRHATAGAERDLRTPTADVDDHRGPRTDARRIHCGLVNQPSLFAAGDDADANPEVPMDCGDEIAAVFSLADGTGGRGDDFVHTVRIGQALELRQRLHGRRNSRDRKGTAVQTAGPQPNHVLLAIDHFEGQIRPDAAYDHVDGIGPDVDGRDSHALHGRYRGWTTQVSHATTPPLRDLAAIIRALSAVMTRDAARAIHGDAVSVHDARVAARRLREALALVTASPRREAAALRAGARRLRGGLGPVREADVQLAWLNDRARAWRWRPAAVARVRSRLMAQRRHAAKAAHHLIAHLDLARLVGRSARVTAWLEKSPSAAASTLELAVRARIRAHDLLEALGRAGPFYSPERLHEARIAAKKLRYVLELARDLHQVQLYKDIFALRAAQDTLGRLHDLQELQSAVDAVAAEVPADGAVRQALVTMSGGLAAECRRIHAMFLPTESRLANTARRAESFGRAMARTRVAPDRSPSAVTGGRATRERPHRAGKV